ncbi:ligand-binding sensor domain-containing protein [Xanthomonas graminis]|uniref:Diguanylate cyclase n=1 Tax=Xanthomonas graminis pv. graminis TaxID=134874 RepID=A0A1M4L821_9XANT|nr:two-component regulator propeller domain-containing protein [Xanthomonas translucens]SBV89226.1 diguanylate cyclase [Xanthomonas translucens pv. graminis]
MPNSHPSPSPSLLRGIAWRLAAVLALCACIGAVAAQEYSFRNYAQADGLQGLSINCLYADRHGVVWACTELGLHRYERERFEQIGADTGFGSPLVHAIAEDRRQRMWVGTSNALYVGDGRRFAAVPAADGRRLRVDQGQSLAAFGDDIVVLSDKRPLRISAGAAGGWQVAALRTADAAPLAEVYSVTAIGEALWLGCGRALCRLDAQGRLQRLGRADGVPDDIWLALLRDRNGTLWARSIHHILAWPAGAAGFSERAPPPGSGLSTMAVGINLVEDAAGRVLTRSDTGLLRWEGGQWRAFERAQGLEALAPNIAPLLSDRQGRLWMGTRGRGVQRWLGYGLIQHWEEPQGLATAPTWSILRSRGDGRLYVGSEMGANVLDPVSGRMLPLTDTDGQALRQTVQLVDAADGTLWLGQSSGRVLRLDRRSGRMREQAKVLPALKCMFFDDAGTLWILTTSGLFLLPAGEPSAQPARDLPRDQFVGGGYDARHRLWLVGQNGLYLRQGQG